MSIPGYCASRAYLNGETLKVYKGLMYRTQCAVIRQNAGNYINLEELTSDIPDTWHLINKHSHTHTIQNDTQIYVNGFPVIKTVTLSTAGKIDLNVGCQSVELSCLGLPDNLLTTPLSLKLILSVIKDARVCEGKEVSRNTAGYERWTIEGNEDTKIRKRSPKCQTLLPMFSKMSLCTLCHYVRNKVLPYNDEDDNLPCGETNDEDDNLTGDETMLHLLFPNATTDMLDIIRTQSKCCRSELAGTDSRGRRWPKSFLSLALSIWIASPAAYRILKSKLYLPSESLLQKYKNSLDKDPGINHDMLTWMLKECERHGGNKQGGIIFDEMTIQSGLQLQPNGEGLDFFGLVDEDSASMSRLLKHKDELSLAKSILQFVYVGMDGFRFPFCYYLTDSMICSQLLTIIWGIINVLKTYGFTVIYISVDGASTNRSLFNNICTDIPRCIARNICSLDDEYICLIMDFSHVIKRIRNCVYSSGVQPYHIRELQTPSGPIVWKMFYDAYMWDKETNTLRIHRRLTDEHLRLNSALKMRNHLAENILDFEMLNLMRQYQASMKNNEVFAAVLQFLGVTSTIIQIFRSPIPIKEISDDRLQELHTAHKYFVDWKQYVISNKLNMRKCFITSETMMDIGFLVNGFISLCDMACKQGHNDGVIAARINSDVVENIFCQQRTLFNGANVNPDASQYR